MRARIIIHRTNLRDSALRLLYLRGADARGIEVQEGFVTYENLSFDYTKLLLECPSIGKVLCLVEAEFLLRFLLCMMLQELREAIQTCLKLDNVSLCMSLCRGRHNRGFSVFISCQVCAFLLRCSWCFCLQRLLWCMVLQELREAIQTCFNLHNV